MKVQQGKSDDSYTIDHSGTILVIDPKGNWYALFNTPHEAKNIAKDFETIVANYSAENG
jgi:protein SCO1/2